jgi:glycosyltransferase involved in cell wall biosynthesis
MSEPPKRSVLLVGNYEKDQQESMHRFVSVLLRKLPEFQINVELIRPSEKFGRRFKANRGLGKWAGYVDKFILFPRLLRNKIKTNSDGRRTVHICDHSNAIYTHFLKGIPHLVNCHDLLAIRSARGEIPENPTRWTGRQLQRLILNGLNCAQHVACISEATRRDLLRLSRLSSEAVDMIPMGLNYDYHPITKVEALRTLQPISESIKFKFQKLPFILHVGGDQWYKNRLGVLRIYDVLLKTRSNLPDLVMVGKPFTSEMTRFVDENRMTDRVFSLVSCANEELRALYSIAELLLFPSLQEGFGWPIIEAHACGCRVATTNRSPMTEVGGDAAIYFDPQQAEAGAATVWRILKQTTEEKSVCGDRGLQNAARFSTGEMVARYSSLYEKLNRAAA